MLKVTRAGCQDAEEILRLERYRRTILEFNDFARKTGLRPSRNKAKNQYFSNIDPFHSETLRWHGQFEEALALPGREGCVPFRHTPLKFPS